MIFLVELVTHDGVSAGVIPLATDGYTTRPTDSPPNKFYMPRLKAGGAGSISRFMFASGTTGGPSQVGHGAILAINGRPYGGTELIDNWVGLSFRTATIKSLETTAQPLSQAVVRAIATCEQLVSTDALDGFDVGLHDRLSDLDRPLQTNAYAGTTTSSGLGIEGEADLQDQVKPKVWGKQNNVNCVPVNVYDLLFQVNDGPVTSIAVYDGGLALTGVGDFGSVSALVAASVLPGRYATCLALGVFKTGGQPAGTITADVVEGATIGARTAGQIASRMFTWFQVQNPTLTATLAPGMAAAMDALNDAEVGITITGEETFLAALARLLTSVGGYCLPQVTSASLFNLGRFNGPAVSAADTFELDGSLGGPPQRVETGADGRGIPAYRVIVKYDHIGVSQTGDALFGNVTPARRAYLKDEWRQVIAEDLDVLTQFPDAPVITIETCLLSQVEAQAEADRLLALHSVLRDCYVIKQAMEDEDPLAPWEIGTTQELISKDGRMGLGTESGEGKNFIVIGREDDFSEPPIVTMTIWG